MKRIFIGSSKEAIAQAQQIAALLSDIDDVKPILWTDAFQLAEITFIGIEDVARKIAGAVFLATPDDHSIIRGQTVNVPRANVLFEYGYLTASLTRKRVALCRYADTELPSDLAGLTFVPMGAFSPNSEIDHQARVKLRLWASELPATHEGVPATCLLHGYSGVWHNETVYSVWRRIPIKAEDYAVFRGTTILHISPNGEAGNGCVYGTLQVQIENCYAEFEISDRITDARVNRDGSLKLRSVMQSRQRMRIEGRPPQKDGFETMLKGAREYESVIYPPSEVSKLQGHYISEVGGVIYSDAIESYERP